jgi:hypothetical protein
MAVRRRLLVAHLPLDALGILHAKFIILEKVIVDVFGVLRHALSPLKGLDIGSFKPIFELDPRQLLAQVLQQRIIFAVRREHLGLAIPTHLQVDHLLV